MRSNTLRDLRSLSWVLVACVSLASVSCSKSAETDSGTDGGRLRDSGTDARIPDADVAHVPPQWPWRGLTLIHAGMAPDGSTGAKPSDIDELVSKLHINSVHLYMHVQQWAASQGLSASDAWTQSIAWVDSMLDRCRADGIVGIVHFDSIIDGTGFYDQNVLAFWNDPAAIDQLYAQVTQLATHLHSRGNELAAYDIISEPVATDAPLRKPPNWPDVQKQIVQKLRAADPGRWVVVKPAPYAAMEAFASFSPLSYDRLVYTVHIYKPHAYTHQGIRGYPYPVTYPGTINGAQWNRSALESAMQPLFDFQTNNDAYIWVGEFSALRWAPGSDQYLHDLVSIYESHGFGWSYISWGGYNGWNPLYNDSYASSGAQARMDLVGETSPRWATLMSLFGVSSP